MARNIKIMQRSHTSRSMWTWSWQRSPRSCKIVTTEKSSKIGYNLCCSNVRMQLVEWTEAVQAEHSGSCVYSTTSPYVSPFANLRKMRMCPSEWSKYTLSHCVSINKIRICHIEYQHGWCLLQGMRKVYRGEVVGIHKGVPRADLGISGGLSREDIFNCGHTNNKKNIHYLHHKNCRLCRLPWSF